MRLVRDTWSNIGNYYRELPNGKWRNVGRSSSEEYFIDTIEYFISDLEFNLVPKGKRFVLIEETIKTNKLLLIL